MATEPNLLCMLSDEDMGMVGPDELVKLYAWVVTQPEVATAPA